MFSYKFRIDQETCFVYWAQSCVQWNWYFNQKEVDKWIQVTGKFTGEEERFLIFLKEILQKNGNGYFWLWSRYMGNEIKDIDEQKRWLEIRKVLEGKFKIIWQSEYPKLLIWLDKLEQYKFNDLESNLNKINGFFGGRELDSEIEVKLLFGFGKHAGGNTKKEFPNLLLLSLSGADVLSLESVLKVILHESIHLIEYSSGKDLLFRESYKKIIVPLGIKQSQPSWRHLIIESIIGSIVGRGVGYLDKKINYNCLPIDREQNRSGFYNQKISVVSGKIAHLTEEYIKSGKEMDAEYVDFVLLEIKKEFGG